MKKALILHWWEGKSDSHWLPWLWEELKKQWYNVILPSLPNTDYPVIGEQLAFLNQQWNLLEWDVIVGHSLWCQLWLQYIEQKELTWLKVIFVAPSYNYLADELGEDKLWDAFVTLSNYYNSPNIFSRVNKLSNSYSVMLSDDDPYINSFSAKEYYWHLDNINFVYLKWRWHFNTSAWITQIPELLDCL